MLVLERTDDSLFQTCVGLRFFTNLENVLNSVVVVCKMAQNDEWTVISRQKRCTGKSRSSKWGHKPLSATKADIISAQLMNATNRVNIFDSIFDGKNLLSKNKKAANVEATVIPTSQRDSVIAGLVEMIIKSISFNVFICKTVDAIVTDIANFEQSSAVVWNYEIVVLGLGHFTESYGALLQLAFSLLLVRTLRNTSVSKSNSLSSCNVSLYDPVLSAEEVRLCTNVFDVRVPSDNSMGKIKGKEKTRTIFYMPHCPYQLYCNVLWANWFNLDSIYIIGNR